MRFQNVVSALVLTALPFVAATSVALADDSGPVLDNGDQQTSVEVAGVQDDSRAADAYVARRNSYAYPHVGVGTVPLSALQRPDSGSSEAEVAGVRNPGDAGSFQDTLNAYPNDGQHVSVGTVGTSALERRDSRNGN